jgi:hypothetical protein
MCSQVKMQKEVLNARQRSTNIQQAVKRAVAQLLVVIMEMMRRMVTNCLQRERRKDRSSTPSRRCVNVMFCAFSCSMVGEGVNADSLSVCLSMLSPVVTCGITVALYPSFHSWFTAGLNGKQTCK